MSQYTDAIAWVKGDSSRSAYRAVWPASAYIFSLNDTDVTYFSDSLMAPYDPPNHPPNSGGDVTATDWTESNDRPPHK